MIYLSGCTRAEIATLAPRAGLFLTPMMGNFPDRRVVSWAADTGCFTQKARFRLDYYLAWLERQRIYQTTCFFATAPDVLGDARATWKSARYTLPVLRALGWRAALCAQDGIERTRIAWDAFDVLFIGGTTQWKLSPVVEALVSEAKTRGKWTHMGRVNSGARLRYAAQIGCDSADGTYLAFGPTKNLPNVRRWLDALEREPSLWSQSA